MATAVIMPRQGQTVESCLLAAWKKQPGDQVAKGEIICEIETDKALVEVESPASGLVLALFFQEGAEIPVLTNIAVIGDPGETIADFRPARTPTGATPEPAPASPSDLAAPQAAADRPVTPAASTAGLASTSSGSRLAISPRARRLAARKEVETANLAGSGPGGRIIERDIEAAPAKQPKMTPLARAMAAQAGYSVPPHGSGSGGRVRAGDLRAGGPPATGGPETTPFDDQVEVIPVKGTRRVIAGRMLESLQTTAQLTLTASARAQSLLAYRKRLKNSPTRPGRHQTTLTHLILFVVSRTLPRHPILNTLFSNDTMYRYTDAHLGFAVDTPRGLMVPVIRRANRLSLEQISQETNRLARACLEGVITPAELKGGTFTVTNLGRFGVETFTPLLNPPQVGVLGVGNINLKPTQIDDEVQFIPHLSLSLTINHQIVDGAPGARFLQALCQGVAEIELLAAV